VRAVVLAPALILAAPAFADEAAAERAMAQARAQAGLAVTTADPRLVAAARAIAEDNATRGELDHVDARGGTLRARTTQAGYAFRLVAENLAVGTPDGAVVVRLWLDSPEHRANLLNAGAAHHGLARARGPDGRDYWAAIFGAPLR
jgi:uncharacterized protein YkwD